MSNMNSTEFSNNLTFLAPSNHTTTVSPMLSPINVLLAQLGFQTWRTLIITFILPPINLIGAVLCSFSLWIFFRSAFSDPIYFYYKLLCFINIIHLLHNIPYSISIWALFFSYLTTFYTIYYSFSSVLLFHYEDVLRMAILLHKMKLFSPFVRKHFSATPLFISLSLFLTCLCIDIPLLFGFEVGSLGEYSYFDSSGVKQIGSFHYLILSEFSRTFFGHILLGLSTFFLNFFLCLIVGITLNISSYRKYKSHVRKRQKEKEDLQMSSIHNRPTTNREMLQENQREKIERKIEKNMLYMALTLCSMSILSRFIFMISYVYYFLFKTFSNSLIIGVVSYFIFTFGPTVSIFVFYSFNNTFRDELNKRLGFWKN